MLHDDYDNSSTTEWNPFVYLYNKTSNTKTIKFSGECFIMEKHFSVVDRATSYSARTMY